MVFSITVVNNTSYQLSHSWAGNGGSGTLTVNNTGTITVTDIGQAKPVPSPGNHTWGIKIQSGTTVGYIFYDGGGTMQITVNPTSFQSFYNGNAGEGSVSGPIDGLINNPMVVYGLYCLNSDYQQNHNVARTKVSLSVSEASTVGLIRTTLASGAPNTWGPLLPTDLLLFDDMMNPLTVDALTLLDGGIVNQSQVLVNVNKPITKLPTPTNVVLTSNNPTSASDHFVFHVTWTPVVGAVKYSIIINGNSPWGNVSTSGSVNQAASPLSWTSPPQGVDYDWVARVAAQGNVDAQQSDAGVSGFVYHKFDNRW